MKAIETKYRGYRFRSRTEAKWAVFFTTLKFRWEYEPEGFQLSSGHWYLPDFKFVLPNDVVWFAEVKYAEHEQFEGETVDKCRALARDTGANVVLLNGLPEPRIYNAVGPKLEGNSFCGVFFQDYDPFIHVADDYWFGRAEFDTTSGTSRFEYDERALRKSFGGLYLEALQAARSARFEFGESG